MSFLFVFLAFFFPFLPPSFSLPLANPPVLDTTVTETEHRTVVERLPTPVLAKESLLPYAPRAPAPSPDSPILFLPQHSSDGAIIITDSGAAANASLGSEPLPASNSSGAGFTPLMMAYYPGWVANNFPPERIDFSRFDWIDFAFAEPDENFVLNLYGSDILSRLVNVTHQCGKNVKLSIGGWSGSKQVNLTPYGPALTPRLRYFSLAVQNDTSRHTFVDNIVDIYHEHNLDGIDIDWEYPGTKGHPQNLVHPTDSANLLEFFKLLRTKLPPTARITAAVQTTPFAGVDGQPLNDVRAFAGVLDWVVLMNYDVWGGASVWHLPTLPFHLIWLEASSNPGPNAPLDDNACRNSSQPTANAKAAVEAWEAAGFPPDQLVLGLPSYGYISRSSATHLYQRDGNPSLPRAYAVTDEGADTGQVQFRDLVPQVLCKDPTRPGVYVGRDGFTREWDECSSTPFAYSGEQVVTYDDPQSLGRKSAFAKQYNLRGVNIFDVHGDTDEWELVDSVRQALGLL